MCAFSEHGSIFFVKRNLELLIYFLQGAAKKVDPYSFLLFSQQLFEILV